MARPKLERSGSWDLETASTQYTDYRICEQMHFQLASNDVVNSFCATVSPVTP
jgi:hypothetical protein